ncbi:tRNA lysidine(34) synthetase TilS [Flavobacterium agricola]|uniref:tRNA lysidine(34) synthetase TilS n=1 Tax=Flavobacterium agricola TaxID=2870839 RepID=UPI0029390C47|nr:tRNA lysidine(34) synthetase TilS [Flavobacterium agricola]
MFKKIYFVDQNLAHHIIYFDTEQYAEQNKLSIQLAARKLRYDWFYKLIDEHKLDYILTAHHLDDQVETFLINVTRGTGVDGILGIPPKNDKILRPMLTVSRDEILNYAQANNIEWREDSSNQSTKYFRNKIRHQVVPVLKELNTDFLQSFTNTLTHLNQFNQGFLDGFSVLKKQIVTPHENYVAIAITPLMQLQAPQAFLFELLKPFGFTAWNDIYALPQAKSGKIIYSATHLLLKNRNELLLKNIETTETESYIISSVADFEKLPVNISVNYNRFHEKNDKLEVFLDLEKLKFPLILRKWKEGDYFYPFGMNGKKNIAKFFKDEKLSQFQKNETWLLVQNNDIDIIWIVGHRADKRFLATINSINTIQLQI